MSSQLEELARRLFEAEQASKRSRQPGLQFSSIDDGSIPEYDADGNLKTVIGAQFDGGHGVLVTSDPEPLQPSPALVFAGPGTLTARWDGVWCDAAGIPDETIPVPTWHSRVEIHASQDPDFEPITAATLRDTIETPRGGERVLSFPDGGTWYIRLVARSQSGNAGPASDPVFGEPAPVVLEGDIVPAVDARLSASGTVQIVSNDVEPPAPVGGWRTGAIWWQTAGPGPLGNVVTWHRYNGSAWVEQQVDEAFLPLVNIGTGTFGNLSGSRIQLGSVQPDALAAGTNELLPNAKWMAPGFDALYGPDKVALSVTLPSLAPAAGWSFDTTAGLLRYGQPKILKIDLANTVQAEEFMPVGPKIPINGGDKFYLQLDTYSTGNPNVVVSLQTHCFRADGTYISAGTTKIDAPTTNPQDVWQPQSKVVTAPNGTAYIIPIIRKALRSVAGVGVVYVGAMSVRRVLSGADASGQYADLSPKGIQLFDAEGAEVVSLTSTPPNYLNITGDDGRSMASIGRVETGGEGSGVYEGIVAGDNMNIENDPTIAGDKLLGSLADWESPALFERTGWLDDLARGTIAWGSRSIQARQITNGEFAQMELQFDYFAGRSYLIVVEPLSCYVDPGTYGYIRIRRVYSDQTSGRPTLTSPMLKQFTVRNQTTALNLYSLGGSFILDANATATCRMLISIGAEPGTIQAWNSSSWGTLRVMVYDMGMRVEETGVNREDAAYLDTTPPSSPAPPPEIKNYTKTYSATAYRSYYASNGSFYNWNTSKMFQGNSPAVGGLHSIALFPSFLGDLSGATITSIRAFFYFDFWYYNSGGTAKIMLHSRAGSDGLPSAYNSSNLTFAVTSSSWPKPGGRWVNIPSSFWAGFKSGLYRGVGLGDTTPSTTEYGYARGSATKIEIKFKK